VLYDGGCPLCRREIAHYRRLRGADALRWVDISREEDTLSALGIPLEQAMARLHVRDAAGIWHTGAWGFAELWRHLPGYRLAAGALRTARLLPLLDLLYSRFARWRQRRQCGTGACATRRETAIQSEE
jgi:predicted DCC family thiol-disulfide oxidoreductase YuxK